MVTEEPSLSPAPGALTSIQEAPDTYDPPSTSYPPEAPPEDTANDHTGVQQLEEDPQPLEQQESLQVALERVKELEDQLQQTLADKEQLLQQQNDRDKNGGDASSSLESFLGMLDTVGEAQAVEWARNQVQRGPSSSATASLDTITPYKNNKRSHIGFTSPMPASPAIRFLTPSGTNGRPPRAATPHPRRDSDISDTDAERQYHAFFIDAATLVPHEYETEIATFCVRRPYGLEDPPELFADCSLIDPDKYGRRAHVSGPSSIEVVAMIPADDSYLVLSGESNVRIYSTYEEVWKEFNVDEMDRPLGYMSYIDDNAQEQEYSLDDIYEGALLARQDYCSTLFSTAMSLRDRPAPMSNGEPHHQVNQPPMASPSQKSPTKDASVNTDKQNLADAPASSNPAGSKKVIQTPPPVSPAADDVSGGIIGWIFGAIFGLIWTIIWRIPMAVVRSTIVAVGTTFVLTIIWMYLEDGGASQANLGAYNGRGIM
jgi:hypothetical protein